MPENFQILPGTNIQIDLPLDKKKVDSVFIGSKKTEYLILKMPDLKLEEISLYFLSGNEVILRFLHEGNIIAFKSKIIGTILNPFKLIFFSYPEEIKDINLRKSPRVKCFLPGTIKKDDLHYDGMVVDLGKLGGLFSFKIELIKRRLFKINDRAELFFKVPGNENELNVQCMIKNVKREKNGLSIGLQFIELPSHITNSLNEYITIFLSYT